MLCVHKFAPEKKTVKKQSHAWINNKMKNETTKRNQLVQNWMKTPTEKKT